MINLTESKLEKILQGNKYISEWYESLMLHLSNHEMDTDNRVAAFIGQCAYESNNFRTLRENLNYRASSLMRVWPRHFPTEQVANTYAHKPEMIANRAYANRMGNGSESSGDGWRYAGKGIIQLTGYNNYQKFASHAKMDIADIPDYLLTFDGAVHGACWFFYINKLNRYSDNWDIKGLTKRINGGYHGLSQRIKKCEHALSVLRG